MAPSPQPIFLINRFDLELESSSGQNNESEYYLPIPLIPRNIENPLTLQAPYCQTKTLIHWSLLCIV